MLGTDKLYWSVLKEYTRTIEAKASSIEKAFADEDWPEYTIEVHALKSSSRQIGAERLGDLAAEMEIAGNERNIASIKSHTSIMLDKYKSYISILQPYFEEKEEDTSGNPEVSKDILEVLFEELRSAMDDLDMGRMEDISVELQKYSYPEDYKPLLDGLVNAIADIDVDTCTEILDEWVL